MPRWASSSGVHVGRAVDPLRQLGDVVALVAVLRRLLARGRAPGSTRRSARTWLPASFT